LKNGVIGLAYLAVLKNCWKHH